jgi:TRAP transporter TAXI family solute receptor
MKAFKTLLTAAVITMASSGAALAKTDLLIGSTSTSSSQYGYFVAVSQIINDKVPGVRASVVETGATVDNLRRIARKQVDLGLVTTNVGYHANAGVESFEGRKVENRLLWVYTMAPQNVVVREDSGVKSLAELKGQRFNPGITGSATEKTAEAVMKVLGVAPDYVRGSTTDIVASIKDNRAIGYVKSGAGNRLDGSSMDIATFSPIRVLSLNEAQKQKLEAEMPDISVVDVPAGAADGVPAYSTWSFGLAVHARPDLDEKVAYQIVKAVMENMGPQVNALSNLKGADLAQTTVKYGTVPLHPGAARYLRERGLSIPAKLQPTD